MFTLWILIILRIYYIVWRLLEIVRYDNMSWLIFLGLKLGGIRNC